MRALGPLSVGEYRAQAIIALLQEAGADFGYVFGSQARGDAREESDINVAVHFPGGGAPRFRVGDACRCGLAHLNDAPLAIKGRVATEGVLLFESDSVSTFGGWRQHARSISMRSIEWT